MDELHGSERVRDLFERIIEPLTAWVKTLVSESSSLDIDALERRVRDQGIEQLRLEGGAGVWDWLRRTRWRYEPSSPARRGLEQLLGYLERHAPHLDYPAYIRRGWPISSGPMESACKQLGLRLKGCGMRWNQENVTPMARLVCRWNTGQPLKDAA